MMRQRTGWPVATGLAVLLAVAAGTVHARGEAADWIGQAVEAHGGDAALGGWSNQRIDAEAMLYFGTNQVEGEMTIHVREGAMLRREALINFGGTPFQFTEASTGRSAWRNMRARVYDYPPDDFNTWLSHRPDILLRASRAADEDLTFRGELDVDGAPAVRIDFVENGTSTQILIDSETHLVRVLEYKAMENSGEGRKKEVFLKRVFDEYAPAAGVPFPHRIVEYSEGVKSLSLQVTGVTFGEMPEVELFAKPVEDDEAREWGDQLAD